MIAFTAGNKFSLELERSSILRNIMLILYFVVKFYDKV